jgi:hypothetical protein
MNDDELDNIVDDLVERYVAYLRGQGPKPDLSVLPPDRQADLLEEFKIIAALADRDSELPPLDQDPVAVRLGLVGRPNAPTVVAPRGPADDLVEASLNDVASRFDRQVAVDFRPPWARDAPAGLRPVAECSALGEAVAVFVSDRNSCESGTLAAFLDRHPYIAAISLVSRDAQRATLVYPGDVHGRVDPLHGWIPPQLTGAIEPLTLSLGRLFEQCLPVWDRTATLDEITDDADLHDTATDISQRELATARQARPRLAYKKAGAQVLQTMNASMIADIVLAVQSGQVDDDDLLDDIARIADPAAA